MKIVKDKHNVVLFAGEGLILTEKSLSCPEWIAPGITSMTHTIEDVAEIPDDYRAGEYFFDAGWKKTHAGEMNDSLRIEVQISANRQEISASIQQLLDTTAKQYGYDNIHTACGWSDNFIDAANLKNWGADCWRKAGEIEAGIKLGNPILTKDEIMRLMPLFEEV